MGEGGRLVIGLGQVCPRWAWQDRVIHAGRRKEAGRKRVLAGAPRSEGACTEDWGSETQSPRPPCCRALAHCVPLSGLLLCEMCTGPGG